MTADVLKEGGYVVVSSGGAGASVPDSKGYVVQSTAAAGGAASAQRGHVVMTNGAVVPAMTTQVVLANKAVVSASAFYAIAHHPGSALAAPGYAVMQTFYPPYEDITLPYSFLERRFPECVSFGSQGGPGFKTSVFTFDSGITTSDINWERMRGRYEATFENVTPTDIEEVEDFFYGMRGKALAFRYKDWTDYQISSQNVGVGTGTDTTFQIFKRYQSGQNIFDRIIKKTVIGTSQVSIDGVGQLEGSDYFMLDAEGRIVFMNPPAAGAIIRLDYIEYDVPVRFDTDYLNISYDDFRQLNTSVDLIEVLV